MIEVFDFLPGDPACATTDFAAGSSFMIAQTGGVLDIGDFFDVFTTTENFTFDGGLGTLADLNIDLTEALQNFSSSIVDHGTHKSIRLTAVPEPAAVIPMMLLAVYVCGRRKRRTV